MLLPPATVLLHPVMVLSVPVSGEGEREKRRAAHAALLDAPLLEGSPSAVQFVGGGGLGGGGLGGGGLDNDGLGGDGLGGGGLGGGGDDARAAAHPRDEALAPATTPTSTRTPLIEPLMDANGCATEEPPPNTSVLFAGSVTGAHAPTTGAPPPCVGGKGTSLKGTPQPSVGVRGWPLGPIANTTVALAPAVQDAYPPPPAPQEASR